MRMVGLEPTRGRPRKILSLVRLPFRHIRILSTSVNNISNYNCKTPACQSFYLKKSKIRKNQELLLKDECLCLK